MKDPVPKSGLANTPNEARQVAAEIGYPVVLKAQVLSGGRGKAGGIRLVKNDSEIDSASNLILNSEIHGIPVQRLLVEKAVVFSQEFYLGIVNDRSLAKPVLILSSSGGVEIEVVARTKPEKIEKAPIKPCSDCKTSPCARWHPGWAWITLFGKRFNKFPPPFGICLIIWTRA